MADFELKLLMLAERGTRVGPEEMIERVEAHLAEDPLVVVNQQRKGRGMSVKTEDKQERKRGSTGRGLAWAAAAFVVLIGIAALYLTFSGEPESDVVQPAPPTTTVAPETEGTAASDQVATVGAGLEAWFAGDWARVEELFAIPLLGEVGQLWSEEMIRSEIAYQALIGGEMTGDCHPVGPSDISCTGEYENTLTKAIDEVCCAGDVVAIRVDDGLITRFPPPEHAFVLAEMGVYMDSIGRFDEYVNTCWQRYDEACARLQLDNVEGFAEWRPTISIDETVRSYYGAWNNGDCQTASLVDFTKWKYEESDCPNASLDFSRALGARIDVGECAVTGDGDDYVAECELTYSDARTEALGSGPLVLSEEFTGGPYLISGIPIIGQELNLSFEDWATGDGGIGEDYQAVCPGGEECADLIIEHLEDWAAWYRANG